MRVGKQRFDRIVIGAGIYGLYAAGKLSSRGYRTLLVEAESEPFTRGSYVNQARVHNGYHYPRSYSTAAKSAHYFERFQQDFGDCINGGFEKYYAIAKNYSWTNAQQFQAFCSSLHLPCTEVPVSQHFNPTEVEAVFRTKESSFDARLVCKKMMETALRSGCEFSFGSPVTSIAQDANEFVLALKNAEVVSAPFVLNATYASINQIHRMMELPALSIKYELCEVILCEVPDSLKGIGLTLMDGPFFSLMPFGQTGYHSITTVSRTPHLTSLDSVPTFPCQEHRTDCTPQHVHNCNTCPVRPISAFHEMSQIAKKYLLGNVRLRQVESLFALKPILKTSEIDDSRPTLVRVYSEAPRFISVFSGKINTIYDLDPVLE